MKRIRLIWLVLIILATATPPTWAQVGPVKQQESEDAMTYLRLGVKHFMANRYVEAVEAYKQAIRLKPDFAGAYHNLGYVYDELGRYKEALESYKHAVQLTPNDAGMYSNMAVTYRKMGRYKEAVASCKQAISLRPD
ncbi:MAG: tetratricopeptide repeat protein, partial [Pyrinomonadaceae bacterium]|nr:tetratricopeptide repeat protein [Pyrinomonadaceae bacterium]